MSGTATSVCTLVLCPWAQMPLGPLRSTCDKCKCVIRRYRAVLAADTGCCRPLSAPVDLWLGTSSLEQLLLNGVLISKHSVVAFFLNLTRVNRWHRLSGQSASLPVPQRLAFVSLPQVYFIFQKKNGFLTIYRTSLSHVRQFLEIGGFLDKRQQRY